MNYTSDRYRYTSNCTFEDSSTLNQAADSSLLNQGLPELHGRKQEYIGLFGRMDAAKLITAPYPHKISRMTGVREIKKEQQASLTSCS